MASISIPVLGPPTSAAVTYLRKTNPPPETPPENETPLLRAIRKVLRGSDAESATEIHRSILWTGNEVGDRELHWNSHTAVLSTGGIIIKQWSFKHEEESIQWACLGQLEVSVIKNASSAYSAANFAANAESLASAISASSETQQSERPTYGPYTRAANSKPDIGGVRIASATFIFLRSLVKVYLDDGEDFSFSLPFIVRKAWPVSPHGIIMQRVLEPAELEEAQITGDEILPTIFSITSPFAEAAAVGLTSGIIQGGRDKPPKLKDEDEHAMKPLMPVPPLEMLVWTSYLARTMTMHLMVTVDVEKELVSVWHYAYIKPKDSPVPLTQPVNVPPEKQSKKRLSTAGGGNRRTSALYEGPAGDRWDRNRPMSPKASRMAEEMALPAEMFELPGDDNLFKAGSTHGSSNTLGSIPSGAASSQRSHGHVPRRSSMTRSDLTNTMNRMALGGKMEPEVIFPPNDHGRMKAAFWMERMYTHKISKEDAQAWRKMSVSVFDSRNDGKHFRCLMSITLPATQTAIILTVSRSPERVFQVSPLSELPVASATALRATRANVLDLFVVKPDGGLSLWTHGLYEMPVTLKFVKGSGGGDMDIDDSPPPKVVSVQDAQWGQTIVTHEDGSQSRVSFDIYPITPLVTDCVQMLALILPHDIAFDLHFTFLQIWSQHNYAQADDMEFECFKRALYKVFDIQVEEHAVKSDPWSRLASSKTHHRFSEDPALRKLIRPPNIPAPRCVYPSKPPHPLLAPLMYGLHILGEQCRLVIMRHKDLMLLAPVICQLAVVIRPEWADYWKRLIPDAMPSWPQNTVSEYLDDRLPVWPPDMAAILYGRISSPEWKAPWHDVHHIVTRFDLNPSIHYGYLDPLRILHEITTLYGTLADFKIPEFQKRAENTIHKMVTQGMQNLQSILPLGVMAPLNEAARSCQLVPPGNWPVQAYTAIGRNDLAASANRRHDTFLNDGYLQRKDYINPTKPRPTINQIAATARTMGGNEKEAVTGVELNLKEFTDIRFGLDRRLEEVARMLCSSTIPSVKGIERPELSEPDQAKEHQNQVIRVAERTLALPHGRAMFTFGSVPIVTRETYSIPKIEFSVRLQPLNIVLTPDVGKIPAESLAWGEFHNGVAAGLRVAPGAGGVQSSWIAFNKPTELSPEHAGFLLGLGLTGHLKEMLSWHSFSYLTPKHDLTSIGVLLGLSAANIGTGNEHVTKLLAVHTPAMLPTPSVDLNVTLLTQAAGLAGIGLLFLGTKNRRMGEICLSQISKRELVQPDLSNEHREAYTYAAALAFGMIMLGKGSTIPADLNILKRLSILIHGEPKAPSANPQPEAFDINLTSPAAAMALGFMYLRTGRKDVADILTIPDTVISLNAIQPTFLLFRTLARALIMWDAIAPTPEWLLAQIPLSIREATEARKAGKVVDDSMELANYNIISGCCFAVGLKYAGTARQEAYNLIVRYFDLFSRLAYTNGPAFDHKIKRSAIRDGLNLISLALSMVMAGTGELSCLRRLRYAYGMAQQIMYHHGFKYGVHVATHMSIGLLFLGGGRFTLGTSDAAIASMVLAFFPRFQQTSADNKSYLQALRHMWVLAVEPRCLIARDVDTNEVVYLPVKIRTHDMPEQTQLISPTLIPDMDQLKSVRVDTPRYWPFYLDTARHPPHRDVLLKSQTLYVKRRTAFLSYTEDPRGSRSLFVRSGSSSGDIATLDFPQLTGNQTHPAGDLSEFITSFSNDVLFLAFADHFSRPLGETPEEELFQNYCHAALLDSILQDKPQTLQAYLTLYTYRMMKPSHSRYFHLRLQDLRFVSDFYSKVYERHFSGKKDVGVGKPPLVRDTTVLAALHAVDQRLEDVRSTQDFKEHLGHYARGEPMPEVVDNGVDGVTRGETMDRNLAWYLSRNSVPVSNILTILRSLANEAHANCLGRPAPDGTMDSGNLDNAIKEVLHTTGTKMTASLGTGWSVRSLDEVIESWKG
ncbi:hypothetical protein CVT24_000097 [Panaeolus cyanescens]|uniref:Uncharacterized protein n=1 Tax=Panaeolus cyanescens TaxID=181874 RepID=A0A409VS13_9AGAR|nr:hypothetical protein CVT24_000097 [Panaeolus cyanescens]